MLQAEGEKSGGQDGGDGGTLAIVSYDEKPVLRRETRHPGDRYDSAGSPATARHQPDGDARSAGWLRSPLAALPLRSRRRTGHDSISSRASSPKLARSVLRHIRVTSKHELKERLMAFIGDINREPVVHTWRYKIDNAA
jgi:hypothetical protein